MKLTVEKFLLTLFLILSGFAFGQTPPPPPPDEETGGIGSYPVTPIDMYVVMLMIVGLSMIVYYARYFKNQTKKI